MNDVIREIITSGRVTDQDGNIFFALPGQPRREVTPADFAAAELSDDGLPLKR